MKLTIPAGEFALPEDFSFEIESNHPFFSDEGTASIPVTIPASPENLDMLAHPERATNSKRYVREYMAFLQSGAFRKQCRMITESAGRDGGVSATLALLESEMYVELQDRKLRDIFSAQGFAMTKMFPHTPYTIYTGAAMDDTYTNALKDVAIFPVASDMDSNGNVSVINKPVTGGLEDNARSVTVNGNTFSAPAGYGISIFIYLWALVEETFTLSGYVVANNPFKTDEELNKIVVVNNCADVCCSGSYSDTLWSFKYADIVPGGTVGDLITFLKDCFGAYVTYSDKTIDIRLIKDDLAAEPDADISSYARDDESVFYPEAKSLERSFDTSIEKAEPAAETLEDLRDSYKSLTNVFSMSEIIGTGLFLVVPLMSYYYRKTASGTPTRLGSSCFKYARKQADITEAEEISSDNRFLPMCQVNGLYMPYIGERVHRHIDVDGKSVEDDQPIQLCYAHLIDRTSSGGTRHFCGSSWSTAEDGLSVTKPPFAALYPALTPEGLLKYWREYESLVLNGAPEIEVTLDLPVETLMSLNRYTPKIYRGSKVMIMSMSYLVSNAGLSTVKAKLKVIPTYDDAITVAPGVPFSVSLVWQLVSTKQPIPDPGFGIDPIIFSDGLEDYKSSDAPDFTPVTVGSICMRRSRWLIYKYIIGGNITLTGSLTWEEYFVSAAQEQ